MEGRLSREDKRRTTSVGAKVSPHPAAEYWYFSRLCHNECGSQVEMRLQASYDASLVSRWALKLGRSPSTNKATVENAAPV